MQKEKYNIYRNKNPGWMKFLGSDDLDKTKNTVEALSQQFEEQIVLTAVDPDHQNVVHIRFTDPPKKPLLIEHKEPLV